jgi:hypothetical protein
MTAPARFAVGMEQFTFGDRARPYYVTTTVLPGDTSGTIDMPYERDRLDDLPRMTQLAVAAPLFGVSTAHRFGSATIVDDDPLPAVTVSVVRNPIRYGQKLRYRVSLAAPVDYYLGAEFVGKPKTGARQLRTSDVPASFPRRAVRPERAPRPMAGDPRVPAAGPGTARYRVRGADPAPTSRRAEPEPDPARQRRGNPSPRHRPSGLLAAPSSPFALKLREAEFSESQR